jgi:hypothetical protein
MLCKSRRFIGASAILITILSTALGSTNCVAAVETPDAGHADNTSATQPKDKEGYFELEPFYQGTDFARKEFAAARSDHAAIALDVGRCYSEIGDPIQWSPEVRAAMLFELDENLMHRLPLKDGSVGQAPKRVLSILNPFHAAAISFSDRVSRNRIEFRRELENSRWWSDVYQWVIIGLGALATVLVSTRSIMTKEQKLAGVISVCAIVCSAAGAAVSSINTFEGGQATALRDQRALSQLQQLHWRIASDVLRQPELCDSSSKTVPPKVMDVVDAWRARLETILDSAVESLAKPGDLVGAGNAEDGAPGTGRGSGGTGVTDRTLAAKRS